jgi:hypothetical protein
MDSPNAALSSSLNAASENLSVPRDRLFGIRLHNSARYRGKANLKTQKRMVSAKK